MPQVPYTGVPSVAPSEQATPNISVDTPIAAFGGTVASAINSVGQVAQHVGNEIFQRAIAFQELQNETVARNQDAEYTVRAGEIEARFRTMQGQNAVQAQAKYNRDLQTLRQQFRDALPNDASRRTFDAHSISTMTRAIFSGATWSAVQNRTWAIQASNARIAANNQNVLTNPSPENYDATVRANEAELRGPNSEIRGAAPETVDETIAKANSKTSLQYLRGLARNDPVGAKEFFERNRERFHDQDMNVAEGLVQSSLVTRQASRIATQVNPILPEGVEGPTLRDRLEQAKIWADAISDNPEFQRAVETATRAQYTHSKEVTRNDQAVRLNTVLEAVQSSGAKSWDALQRLDNPEVSAALDNMNPTQRRQVNEMLWRIARGEDRLTEDGARRFDAIRGMATDPQQRTEFLALNPMELEGIPLAQRLQLSQLQQKARVQTEGDPHLNQVMSNLQPMLSQPDINISRQADSTRYNQFRAAMQDQLAAFQRQKSHPPNLEEQRDIARTLLRNTESPRYWWNTSELLPNWMQGTGLVFEQAVPTPLIRDFTANFKATHGGRDPEPADLEAFRLDYVKALFNRLRGSSGQPKSDR